VFGMAEDEELVALAGSGAFEAAQSERKIS
jgi:hypothetical protein